MPHLLLAFLLAIPLALGACSSENEEPKGAQTTTGAGSPAENPAAPEARTDPAEVPTDALERKIFELAGEYAQLLEPHGPVQRSRLEEGKEHSFQVILHGGRCYKIIGAGLSGVEDLDLVIFDPDGVQVQQDIATDPHPILGLTDPICPNSAGAFRIRAKMTKGAGEFGFRAYGSRL
jgi:hypothetical protein